MTPPSQSKTAPGPANPLKELSLLAMEIRSAACALPSEKEQPLLSQENLDFVVNGSVDLLKTLHDLARKTILTEDHPLYDHEVRHDIRNQLAVVKGFADLMRMELEQGSEIRMPLDYISGLCANFDTVLDKVRASARQMAEEDQAVA